MGNFQYISQRKEQQHVGFRLSGMGLSVGGGGPAPHAFSQDDNVSGGRRLPGGYRPFLAHPARQHHRPAYVVGRGECELGSEVTELETDSVILAPKGITHECRNTSDTDTLKLFCVYIPPIKPTPLLETLIDRTKSFLEER
jgi:hypothetical protein